ncbi:uncharacterized protein LOC131640156 [Vicia villosa]|uniref:uncharacterized protein LOC131640156 n=1 Tax=Vicia villosa TaxID=3911 RepID=UPI00273A8873|nr:uncharacterized protein LOC131640156 [Vicia villosa]
MVKNKIPCKVEIYRISKSIHSALAKESIFGSLEFLCHGDTVKLRHTTSRKKVTTRALDLFDYSGKGKDANKAALVNLMMWGIKHPPPSTVLIISQDRHMAYVMDRLSTTMKFNVVFACEDPLDASTEDLAHAPSNTKLKTGLPPAPP